MQGGDNVYILANYNKQIDLGFTTQFNDWT